MLKANFSADIIILSILHTVLSSELHLEIEKPHQWKGGCFDCFW